MVITRRLEIRYRRHVCHTDSVPPPHTHTRVAVSVIADITVTPIFGTLPHTHTQKLMSAL